MGLILDTVPNHMRTDLSNTWWRDVLEKGERSRYSRYFDIDWRTKTPGLRHKVLVPVLGFPYARALERGDIKLSFEDGFFRTAFGEVRLPLAFSTCRELTKAARDFLPGGDPLREAIEQRLIKKCESSGELA
jgi:(1->4)-alpha-D-glucan 1-alpha-D-glucosylmutase